MRAIGIDFISVLGLSPVEHTKLAASLGCQHISIALAPFAANPHNYAPWSLREDAALRRDFAAALRDNNITISLGEGFLLRPGADIKNAEADMDLLHELGAPIANIVCLEPDAPRAIAQLAAFADMAAARGMKASLEMMPFMPLGSLAEAAAAIAATERKNLGLLLDSMHVFRSGATVEQVAALPPEIISYVQLCDVPLVSTRASYGEEARDNRLPPGQGELPLRAFIEALPPSLMLGLEIPMLDAAKSGFGPASRLAPAIAATRAHPA